MIKTISVNLIESICMYNLYKKISASNSMERGYARSNFANVAFGKKNETFFTIIKYLYGDK